MKLTNKKGVEIPMIGLGTFPFQGRVMADMVFNASKIGYRLFDTADDYRGEFGIGLAVSELGSLGLTREDLFLQTKISDNNAHADEPLIGVYFNEKSMFMKRHTAAEVVREKVSISLREMRTNYIDSLLIHYPYPAYYIDIWKEMIKLKEEGIVRYIGVSNFHERHIENLIHETGVCPEINEVYVSPIGTKQGIIDYCNEHNCLIMTYSPLMDLASDRIPLEPLKTIATKYSKSIAQIILRWNVERGCLPLPKSKKTNRLVENFQIWDFEITKEEVEEISALNKDYQYIVESKTCPGI
ncbi:MULTISPECIES: aldo/keto reductase family protein [Bacteroides]|jgi:diketogulonate reductase-like aldo/keto reductase|uniref:aldo/keto reductase family protein n=1 Tax=Bacteroides TaxID=816 RepID=UPI001F3BF8E5|nr:MULTISPECIES: aldo/keto reductase [Bacteroides]